LSPRNLKTLYYALIHPYIEYGLLLWGNTHSTYINKIVILQKKAIRIINKKPYNFHTNDLFSKSNILKIKELAEFQMIKYMYKYNHNKLPPSLGFIFCPLNKTHGYNTRTSLIIYSTTQNIGRLANKFWAQLPVKIRNAKSFTQFKIKAKKYLLSRYYDVTQE